MKIVFISNFHHFEKKNQPWLTIVEMINSIFRNSRSSCLRFSFLLFFLDAFVYAFRVRCSRFAFGVRVRVWCSRPCLVFASVFGVRVRVWCSRPCLVFAFAFGVRVSRLVFVFAFGVRARVWCSSPCLVFASVFGVRVRPQRTIAASRKKPGADFKKMCLRAGFPKTIFWNNSMFFGNVVQIKKNGNLACYSQ